MDAIFNPQKSKKNKTKNTKKSKLSKLNEEVEFIFENFNKSDKFEPPEIETNNNSKFLSRTSCLNSQFNYHTNSNIVCSEVGSYKKLSNILLNHNISIKSLKSNDSETIISEVSRILNVDRKKFTN